MTKKRDSSKKILILHTGGTIGMGLSSPRRSSSPMAPDHRFVKNLRKNVPELWQMADVHIQALFNKDSAELTPDDWRILSEVILDYQEKYEAFVITHGTDTMAYTGTALSYLLPYPCLPVILTGSQKPLKEIRTDARRNLVNSVAMAASEWICEVSIFFDTVLLRANRSRKVHIEEYHAFSSPNFPTLAEERLNTQFHKTERESLARPVLHPIFDRRIQVVKVFPGAIVDLMPHVRAVVIEAFGCGNLPMVESSVLSLLKKCRSKKIPVVLTSQVTAGALDPGIYEMGRRALELRAISSRDMTFEATIVKCMMLAGNRVAYEDWPAGIQSNWAGEINLN